MASRTPYRFVTLHNKPYPCVWPAGEDPLLAPWRAGRRVVYHPGWLKADHLDTIIARETKRQGKPS